jgi:hypothetical protein
MPGRLQPINQEAHERPGSHARKSLTRLPLAGRTDFLRTTRHLERDATEQAALAEVQNLRSQGHTLRCIAAKLNSRGHRTRRGTEWRLESVVRVIKQQRAAAV